MTYKLISLDQRQNWNEALEGIPHAFAHTWENCYAMNLTTGFPTYLWCFEDRDCRVVCPLAERKYLDWTDITTPYGFSGFVGKGDSTVVSQQWNEFVRERQYVTGYIALNPVLKNDQYVSRSNTYTSNMLFLLDLTQSEAQLFQSIDRNRRRELRKWNDQQFFTDRKILSDFFLNHYEEFLIKVGASAANYFSNKTLLYLLSLENVLLIGAGSNQVEAVYVFTSSPYIADCMFNVAVPAGRKYTTALFWYGVKHFLGQNISWLNMGGGVSVGDSIAQSKQRFGAQAIPFQSLKEVYRPLEYREICRVAGVDEKDRSGYFPAYRVSVDRIEKSPFHARTVINNS